MNFERLVLVCIDANVRNQIFTGMLLTRSIRFNQNLRFTSFCNSPIANFQQTIAQRICIFRREKQICCIFFKFPPIFADCDEMCSDVLRFSRKCRKTLQILDISRLQFVFHHDCREIYLIFD